MVRRFRLLVAVCVLAAVADLQGQVKRPLAIEDHYRVLTITNPQIAPDGKSVRFSVTTRVESDNSTRTESFSVPADGPADEDRHRGWRRQRRRGDGLRARARGPESWRPSRSLSAVSFQLAAFSLQLAGCGSDSGSGSSSSA
jgi:hypothetical protein